MLPAIASSRNGHVVALASRSRERAESMLSGHPDARVCDSYDALLKDRDVDAVYIPLTNDLHRKWTLRALEAGKHVLCEKPLAMNAAEAEDVAAGAERSGRLLMEAFMYRFDGRVRDFVAGIKDPLHAEASFGFHLARDDNYRFHASTGGGALLDVGCYCVSVARWILGEPVDVTAHARFEGGVDLTSAALLVFAGGGTASIWSSFESPEQQEVTVVSRDTVYRLDRPFTALENPTEPYRLMVESFANSILNHAPAEIPLTETIANMHTLDRIRESFSR